MTTQVQHDLQYLGEQARGAELGPKSGTPPDTATRAPGSSLPSSLTTGGRTGP